MQDKQDRLTPYLLPVVFISTIMTGGLFPSYAYAHNKVVVVLLNSEGIEHCDGNPYGGAIYDACGVCGGEGSCVGCDGIPDSGVVADGCGVCGGDNSTCPNDCHGDPGGTAYQDHCNVCVGGNTGESPCNLPGTVSSEGQIWMDRNLGASRIATTMTDTEAYGNLYQWGRSDDGHQSRNSSTVEVLSASDVPGHDSFIANGNLSPPNNWRTPQNDELWQGASGVNNPCPTGFRVPTKTELNNERIAWGKNNQNAAGAFASPLKLVLGGFRLYRLGSFKFVGEYGDYWTSTVHPDGRSGNLWFYSGDADMGDAHRANGFSIRCIQD